MLKIAQIERTPKRQTLRLEGQVLGPWVEELRRSCERILEVGGTVTIDLAEVSFLDREGVALVRALADRQVTLLNSSPFVAEQLKEQACT
jgi:ABC-type transporter Mla MlaB component